MSIAGEKWKLDYMVSEVSGVWLFLHAPLRSRISDLSWQLCFSWIATEGKKKSNGLRKLTYLETDSRHALQLGERYPYPHIERNFPPLPDLPLFGFCLNPFPQTNPPSSSFFPMS